MALPESKRSTYLHVFTTFKKRVTSLVVRDFVLSTLSLKLLNLVHLICLFCSILTSLSRIGQTVEQSDLSQQNLVSEYHGHPVPHISYLLFTSSIAAFILPEVSPFLIVENVTSTNFSRYFSKQFKHKGASIYDGYIFDPLPLYVCNIYYVCPQS